MLCVRWCDVTKSAQPNSSIDVGSVQESVGRTMSVQGVTVMDADTAETPSDVDGEASSLVNDVMMTNDWLRLVFVVLYAVVFLVGLSGNSLVIYVVSRNAAMRTITNIFIANLAVSDIMMCLLAVPFTPAAVMLQSWP